MSNKQARVAVDTLTDGSIVFNVMVGDEEIAAPPSQHEAQALADDYNRRHSLLDIADVQHEEVVLSCYKKDSAGVPIEVLAEINGNVRIGGELYAVKQHCWLNLHSK